jgi:hypothetical protein
MISTTKNNSYSLILASVALFLITLQSFYFYNINLAPFPIMGGLVFLFIGRKASPSKDVLNFIGILVFFFVFSIIWSNLNKLDYIYVNSIIGAFLGLFFFIIIEKYLHDFDKIFITNLLKNVILLHIVFFSIQFLSYYIAGNLIDYLLPITGEESRLFFGGAITGLVRCTGLFNEPATYSYYLGGLVFLSVFVQKKIDIYSAIGLITLALTLSISGILLSTLILAYYTFYISKKFKYLLIFIIIAFLILSILVIFFEDTIYMYVFDRFSNISDDNSTNIRFFDSFEFLKTKNALVQLFGLGIGNYTNETSLTTSGIVSLISSFGIIGYIFFISSLYFFTQRNRLINFMMFNIFLLSTITIQAPFFWFLFSIYYKNAKSNV